MTLPRVPMTLPHRVQVIRVRLGPREAALARRLFHEGLGSSHGVDGIGGLVSGEADQGLHPGGCGGLQHMFCAQYVGSDGLQGKNSQEGTCLRAAA